MRKGSLSRQFPGLLAIKFITKLDKIAIKFDFLNQPPMGQKYRPADLLHPNIHMTRRTAIYAQPCSRQPSLISILVCTLARELLTKQQSDAHKIILSLYSFNSLPQARPPPPLPIHELLHRSSEQTLLYFLANWNIIGMYVWRQNQLGPFLHLLGSWYGAGSRFPRPS
jgi:hypothetical protein